MPKLFGTDGLRAEAGEFPLDEKSVFTLGQALAELLRDKGFSARVVIGRDTRVSGTWLEQCFNTGFVKAGGEAVSAGIITTPALSFLTRTHGFSAGIVISASHNPYHDNGIKIFSPQGTKIQEDWEEELEREIVERSSQLRTINKLAVKTDGSLRSDYLDFLRQLFPSKNRKKLKLVVDCANGASSEIAPELFRSLGFEVVPLNDHPDGKNINLECGSLHPETLARKAHEEKADLGMAYDGDADRVIWVDEQGKILNGDHTLYVQALYLKEKRTLKENSVVATIMSNMGLEKILADNGIKLIRTKVGDKYVLDEMMKQNLNLGGEQSGHTIFLDHSVAGDGLLTSLKMLEVMLERDQPLSQLVRDFRELPQILLNVRVRKKVPFEEIPGFDKVFNEVKDALKSEGRLEVRYSGTEPLARIMIEGKSRQLIEELANKLAKIIEKYSG
jgi:phosphoglucosamine mutase